MASENPQENFPDETYMQQKTLSWLVFSDFSDIEATILWNNCTCSEVGNLLIRFQEHL